MTWENAFENLSTCVLWNLMRTVKNDLVDIYGDNDNDDLYDLHLYILQ